VFKEVGLIGVLPLSLPLAFRGSDRATPQIEGAGKDTIAALRDAALDLSRRPVNAR
jgi:hypothetical protein